MEKKTANYVAYVSSYTNGTGDKFGIRVYDVDVQNGRMVEKEKVKITNSSYIAKSHDEKTLYSITDFGVESYRIKEDGTLQFLNEESINGMRGCYLSTDYDDKFLFSAGYHDGKITVLRLKEDGSIGEITDEIFLRGLGFAAGRNHRPHVQCVKMTRDNKFLCAADLGMDRINVYRLDHETGKLENADVIHCDQESAPRHLKFSEDGRFLYVVTEQKNSVDVYQYFVDEDDIPSFELIQSSSTMESEDSTGVATSALNFSEDYDYLLSSSLGENDVDIYKVDKESGKLDKILGLPIAGTYPKDAALFPDNHHLVSLNHESNSMTFFTVDMKKGTLVMNGPEIKVDQPNCIVFHKLG
ncbi:lactonase family protein [Butyrivibrio sp. NC3005]|uniref:lactonase family protein n=1 Tax=Butyrivibrio sp. NC3005 TaxID=1280685 RepID=UPI000405CFF9|nr:beta-propeller fold lactonase family protein [Butyrivibrio sp. NC3005]